jgi:hypothetical protein
LKLGAMARELELAAVAIVEHGDDRPVEALVSECARVAAALAELRHA